MSPIYATALILNPACRTRYIETYWPKKWVKPVLARVKKLWERYRDKELITLAVSYDRSSQEPSQEPKALDTYDRLALALQLVARPSSGDEYVDFNLEDSYDPGKKGALA
ncbi:hypothetical protein NA56DRAFT_664465 [Hyaloscypha hepaticicola]|uniref:Uncharacterized protein n=1 Tax=Hyaloscypha hepaticicola TaxID=2082293 RepID=A0A2J6PL20_9HELO|nr:hypothetical protein NA56DRAFT_664465 [Hyaloscypha hepaticicola]